MAKASKEEQRKAPILRFKGFTDNWEQRKLNDMSKVYDGIHETPQYTTKGIPFVSVENIKKLTTKKFVSKEFYEKKFKVKPEKNDIFITRIGDIGTSNVVSKSPLAYYVSLALVKINQDQNSYFFKYLFDSEYVQKEFWKRTLHIAFPKKINKNEIGKINIHITNTAEEDKIAQLFNKLESLLALYERKVRLYKLIFKKAINSIVNVSSSSEISLGNIFDVITDYVANGSFKSLRENVKHYSSEEYAYLIRLQDFNNHWKGPWLYTDKKGFDFLKKSKLQTGDIILSNVGSVGKIFQVPSLDKPMTLAPNSILLKTEKNNEDYMYYLMLSSNFQRKLKEKVTPGVQEKINKTDLKKIKIKLPSKNQQDSIAELLKTINSYIKHLQQKASYLKDIKKELLNTMFI